MNKGFTTLGLCVGGAASAFGAYWLYDVMSYILAEGTENVSFVFILNAMVTLFAGILLVIASRRLMHHHPEPSAIVQGAGSPVVNSATEPRTDRANIRCGLCGTDVRDEAIICPACGAQKGVGVVGKFGVVGAGAVTPMRIVASVGWLFVLISYVSWNEGGAVYAVVGTGIMTAITLFNWRVIFWNGSYMWYRRAQ